MTVQLTGCDNALENQHFAYAKTKAQISFAVTAKLISALFWLHGYYNFIYFLNPKFPDCSHPLCLYSSVYVRPVRKPHCWFSRDVAQGVIMLETYHQIAFIRLYSFIKYQFMTYTLMIIRKRKIEHQNLKFAGI